MNDQLFIKSLKHQFKSYKNNQINIVETFKESKIISQVEAEAQFKLELGVLTNWRPSKLQQWALAQEENNYPILKVKEYIDYWRSVEIDSARKSAETAEAITYYQTRQDTAKRSYDQTIGQNEEKQKKDSNKKQKQVIRQSENLTTTRTTTHIQAHDRNSSAASSSTSIPSQNNNSQIEAEKWIKELYLCSDTEKLMLIYNKFGKEKELDLADRLYHSRYWTHISELIGFLRLPHLIFKDEAEWLSMIRQCDGLEELYMIKQSFFKESRVSSGCEYIRSALHKILRLWESAKLLRQNNEGWWQMNVYGPLFDDVFLDSKQYETKRTECSSTAIKTYNATSSSSSSSPSNKLDRHKVDFALRDINKEYDVIVGEDKPPHTSNKDVQETIIKNKRVRMVALDILQKNLPIKSLITQFEELTSFWHGAHLKICGTRRINGISIHYEAARACLSRTPGDFKGLVELMIIVLSVKRQSIRVYEQLGAINHAIFDLSLEYPSISMFSDSSKDDSFEFDDEKVKELLQSLSCPPDEKLKCIKNAMADADAKFSDKYLAPTKLHEILVKPQENIIKNMAFTEPKVDVVEEKSGLFKVAVELPGIEKRDIKIDLEANILSIKAKSRLCYDEETIFIQECNKYHFYRQITLPIHPEPSNCSTSFENGRLNITIKPTSTKAVPIHIL